MKKALIFTTMTFFFTQLLFSQNYFKPVVGGIVNAKDGSSFYKVIIKEKSTQQIYDALLTMVKEKYNGNEDLILEKNGKNYIKAKGVMKKTACNREYDIRSEIELKIKDGRYIIIFTKFNIDKFDGTNRIVLHKGSNVFDSGGKIYMFNRKGKLNIRKMCYKSIVKKLNALGNMLDISDEFEKYASKKEKEESGW